MSELVKEETPEEVRENVTDLQKTEENGAASSDEGKDLKKKKKEKKPEKKKSGWMVALDYALTILITVAVCFLIIKFVAVRSVVEGHSMEPTLSDGNNLIVQKISYYFHEPERFDVIVFRLESNPKTHYIKRVIGLPGETVQIKDGYVYINGEKLIDDIYGQELINEPKMAKNPITVKEGEFFVLGDNRNNSRDSRYADPGLIKKEQILGKAFIRFWPLNKIGIIGK